MDEEKKDYGELKTVCTFSLKIKNKLKVAEISKQLNKNQSKVVDSIIEEYGEQSN